MTGDRQIDRVCPSVHILHPSGLGCTLSCSAHAYCMSYMSYASGAQRSLVHGENRTPAPPPVQAPTPLSTPPAGGSSLHAFRSQSILKAKGAQGWSASWSQRHPAGPRKEPKPQDPRLTEVPEPHPAQKWGALGIRAAQGFDHMDICVSGKSWRKRLAALPGSAISQVLDCSETGPRRKTYSQVQRGPPWRNTHTVHTLPTLLQLRCEPTACPSPERPVPRLPSSILLILSPSRFLGKSSK